MARNEPGSNPDLSEAHECFQVLRAVSFAIRRTKLLDAHRDLLKPEVIWNVEKGLALTTREITKAQEQRVALMQRMLAFFETYDLLLCPATICAAFPVEERYLAECNGHKFDNYVQWLGIVYAITITGCPALSIPCGFTTTGLPVGLQIVGPPRGEASLLSGARVLEDILGLQSITPIDPRPAK